MLQGLPPLCELTARLLREARPLLPSREHSYHGSVIHVHSAAFLRISSGCSAGPRRARARDACLQAFVRSLCNDNDMSDLGFVSNVSDLRDREVVSNAIPQRRVSILCVCASR